MDAIERAYVWRRKSDGRVEAFLGDAAATIMRANSDYEVREFVPASQPPGVVEERDRLRSFVADFLAWRTTADLNRLAGEARNLSDQWGR